MELRRLTSADAELYRGIRLEGLQKNPEAFSSSYEEELEYSIDIYKERLSSETSFTFGAFEGKELIGVVSLVKETRKKLRHRASIFAMYVSHAKRGLGAGKKLMAMAIVHAKEFKEVEQIHLTVMAENEPAKNLYASFGFEVYGTEKHALKIVDRYYDEELRMLFV